MHDVLTPKRRITRLINSARHPDEAAFVARIPVVGRRVPMRGYWQRQSIDPKRAWSHGVAALTSRAPAARDGAARLGGRAANAIGRRVPDARHAARDAAANVRAAAASRLPEARHRAAGFGHVAASTARSGAKRGGAAGRTAISHAPRGRIAIALGAFSLGALLVYFFDRTSGRRRRARVKDRLVHARRVITRDTPRVIERRARFFRGVARGVRHDAADLLPRRHARVDDDTLVARVRSEVLRRAGVPAGDVHVDAYEGCVTLRGQLDTEAEIDRVVEATRRVEGVSEVRSYLHLPGTPPPNKAEAMANGHAPAHLMRQ